jgi:hypothetical protein
MAASSSGSNVLKDLVHPSLNEALKTHNSVTFKLVKTGELFLWICRDTGEFCFRKEREDCGRERKL